MTNRPTTSPTVFPVLCGLGRVFCLSIFFSAAVLACPCLFGQGAAAKSAKTARTKPSQDVIKCSPEGGGEFKRPAEAMSALKKGGVLFLGPGRYDSDLVVSADGCLIEGEPGKLCDANIEIVAKNCSARNLWVERIECNNDFTAVDCIVGSFCTGGDGKADIVFDNCLIKDFCVWSYGKKIFLSSCTCSNGGESFSLGGGEMSIDKSVVYSGGAAFRFTSSNRVKLKIANSVVYGEKSIGYYEESGKFCNEIGALKDICQFHKSGEVFKEKPSFEEMPAARENRHGMRGGGRVVRVVTREDGMGDFASVNLKNFTMREDSPGRKQGWGCNLSKEGFPVPSAK